MLKNVFIKIFFIPLCSPYLTLFDSDNHFPYDSYYTEIQREIISVIVPCDHINWTNRVLEAIVIVVITNSSG